MSITVPLNAAAVPLVRRWPRCPRGFAAPYAKRCGATSLTLAGQSRRKRSTGSLVAGASLGLATPRLGAPPDGSDDFVRISGPSEGFWVIIGLGGGGVDRGLETQIVRSHPLGSLVSCANDWSQATLALPRSSSAR